MRKFIFIFGVLMSDCFFSSVYGQVKNKLQYDTSEIAILTDQGWAQLKFGTDCKFLSLDQEDIAEIRKLWNKCVKKYNNSFGAGFQDTLDTNFRHFKKQLIAVINKKGEKEVWINCFCNAGEYNWKKQIMLVSDGGNCFFNFKINLTKKRYFDLVVNGYG